MRHYAKPFIINRRIETVWNKLKNITNESERNKYNQLLARYEEMNKRLVDNAITELIWDVDPDVIARDIINDTNNLENLSVKDSKNINESTNLSS